MPLRDQITTDVKHTIVCVNCMIVGWVKGYTRTRASREFKTDGWTSFQGFSYCPICSKKKHLK
jgi:hypothetical protein